MAKFLNGFSSSETDMEVPGIAPLYIDYKNEHIVEAIKELITFILYKNNVHIAAWTSDIRHPFNKLLKENSKEICGSVGKMMAEQNMGDWLMKIKGLNDNELDILKNNPIICGLPINLL